MRDRLCRWLPAACLNFFLLACTAVDPGRDYRQSTLASRVEISATPFFPQEDYQCGPAALATLLNQAGEPVQPGELVPLVYLPGREGSLQVDMLATPARYDLLGVRIEPAMPALLELLAAGFPVVVLQNLGLESLPVWHYAVAYGYDLERGEIHLRSGTKRHTGYRFSRFEKTWSRAGNWAMVVVPPTQVPPAVAAGEYLRAASVLERLQRYPAARQAYQAAVRRWPDNALAWAGSGNSAYAQGDLDAAEAAYRKALQRAPDNPLLMNNLAAVLGARGCRQAALALLDCARRAAPDNAILEATRREILQGGDAGRRCRAHPCPFDSP